MQGVYLLHFDKPLKFAKADLYGDERHYIGCSRDIEKRVGEHLAGTGALMTKAAVSSGVTMTLAGLFPVRKDNRLVEAEQMLTRIGAKQFCFICQAAEYVAEHTMAKSPVVTTKQEHRCWKCGRTIKPGTKAGVMDGTIVCYWHLANEKKQKGISLDEIDLNMKILGGSHASGKREEGEVKRQS